MRRIITAISAAVLVMLIASCGGSSNPEPSASPQTTINLLPTKPPASTGTLGLPSTVKRMGSILGNSGNPFFGFELTGDTTIYAPFDGTVYFELLPDEKDPNKFYLHMSLVAEDGPRDQVADKTQFDIVFGVFDVDAVALVEDETRVSAGKALAEVVGPGASWIAIQNPTNAALQQLQVFGFWVDKDGNYQKITPELAAKFLNPRSP